MLGVFLAGGEGGETAPYVGPVKIGKICGSREFVAKPIERALRPNVM